MYENSITKINFTFSLSVQTGNRVPEMSLATEQIQNDVPRIKSPKDNLEELLHSWTIYSSTLPENDATLLGVASEICKILSRRDSFNALEVFLERLPKAVEYDKCQDILRSKIAVALRKRQSAIVLDIIQNTHFDDGEDLIKAWDEAHYIEEENRIQKPLTPLARFRVRKRHPPPKTICASGARKMASLPKGATRVLKQWLIEHYHDPYPTGEEKSALAKLSGLSSNQVKTWFANARRRIHKGGCTSQNMKVLSPAETKEHLRGILLNRNDSADECTSITLPSVSTSGFTPYLPSRYDHACEATDHMKMPNVSYRCLHSMYNSHSCLLCKSNNPDNSSLNDFPPSDARCISHNVSSNSSFTLHPAPGYTLPRWQCYPPVQFRHDDFDAWYRTPNYLNDFHGHYQDFDSTTVAVERMNPLENGNLIESCLQTDPELTKPSGMGLSKDELTEVGAARILADLSTKQNLNLHYDHTGNMMAEGNHV